MARGPNILFLLSDQHNFRCVTENADTPVATPALDRLANGGMRFDAAYCQNPLCVPSRASLITGTHCRSHGIYDNRHILPAGGPTLPRAFAEAGWRTALIGKAHFNGEQFQGFQERPYGDLYGQAHQPDPARRTAHGESGLGDILGDAGPSGIPLAMTQTEICVAEAAKWLQHHAAQPGEAPFFLAVHLDKPHFPINPPAVFFDRHAGTALPVVPEADPPVPFVRAAHAASGTAHHDGDTAVARHALAAYYGCVEWVDDAVGRVLDVLDYLDLARDTLVVYTSDHGEMAARRAMWQKTVFFEDAARVPLILRWPGHIPEGGRCATPVSLIDLFPTLLAAAGLPSPAHLEGRDLAPAWAGGLSPRDVFVESVVLKQPDHAGCMIRRGRWKYALYLDGEEELYDLDADLEERRNLAATADEAAALRDAVRAFWDPAGFRARYDATPRMPREKHFYPFSNQFIGGNGAVFDARP
jgi:choline-sulfatase